MHNCGDLVDIGICGVLFQFCFYLSMLSAWLLSHWSSQVQGNLTRDWMNLSQIIFSPFINFFFLGARCSPLEILLPLLQQFHFLYFSARLDQLYRLKKVVHDGHHVLLVLHKGIEEPIADLDIP